MNAPEFVGTLDEAAKQIAEFAASHSQSETTSAALTLLQSVQARERKLVLSKIESITTNLRKEWTPC